MSNALAVAAVTRTLSSLLTRSRDAFKKEVEDVGDAPKAEILITTFPLDEANKANDGKNAVNVFMYRAESNAAWRNAELPGVNRPNESGFPPLALNLHYLITAYGETKADSLTHLLLGHAMSVLHDHPLLGRKEIQDVLPQSGLHEQLERIRITPQPMTVDEMSKLWTTFQTQYRPSTAYEVAVVLIESARTAHAALPVLRRGRDDQGVFAVPSRAPVLGSVTPERSQPSARLGEALVVAGERLDAGELTLRMTNTRLPALLVLTPLPGGTAAERRLQLPGPDDGAAMADWTPGFYAAEAAVRGGGLPDAAVVTSNQVAWALAPRLAVTGVAVQAGAATITATCAPRLRSGQRVLFLLTPVDGEGRERQVPPARIDSPADPTLPTTVVIDVPAVTVGTYVARLRVDGVDSLPVVWAGTPPRPRFDPDQMVTIAA